MPTLAMIRETDRIECEMESGSSYRDLRRTEIAIGAYAAAQALSGIYLTGFSAYFFELAGLSPDKAFAMSFGFLALGLFGGVLAFLLIQFLGRRAIYLLGLVLLTTLQLFVGILDVLPTYAPHSPLVWAQSILLLLWNFVYDLTIGPVCFILISEISAVRLRAKTIAVATAIQAVLGIFMTVAIPYLINPDEGNMRGKLGFFFGGLAGLSLVWTWFKVPETKDRTFEELDVMFERRVPTREFGNYLTD